MTNLEHLESLKKYDDKVKWNFDDIHFFHYRQAKALEIIAEQLIHLDNTLEAVITTLEKHRNVYGE